MITSLSNFLFFCFCILWKSPSCISFRLEVLLEVLPRDFEILPEVLLEFLLEVLLDVPLGDPSLRFFLRTFLRSSLKSFLRSFSRSFSRSVLRSFLSFFSSYFSLVTLEIKNYCIAPQGRRYRLSSNCGRYNVLIWISMHSIAAVRILLHGCEMNANFPV